MAFQYKPLTRDQIERRSQQKGSIVDPAINPKFEVFRPKVGRNTIRIMPPTWDGFEGWAYTVFMHRNVGPDNSAYLCLRMMREPCPICEEVKELDNSGESESAKLLFRRKTSVSWVLDRAEPDKGPQVWMCGYTIEEDISSRCFHSKTGHEIDIIHPDDGFDVSFRREEKKGNAPPKTVQVEIDRDPSPIDDDQKWQDHWLAFVDKNPIPDVLQYYDYDHIYNLLHGRTGTRNQPREDGENARSTRRRPPPPDDNEPEERGSRRAPPPDEQEERPAARRRPPADEEEERPSGRRAPPPEDAEETRPARRRAEPPEEPEERPRSRSAPPADEEETRPARRRAEPPADEQEERPARRRAAPPPDEDELPPRSRSNGAGNGADSVTQARGQIEDLRRDAESEERPARRRPPADEEEEARPARRRAAPPPDEDEPAPRRRPSR